MTDGETDAGKQAHRAGDTRRPKVGVAGRAVNQPDVIPSPIKETRTVLLFFTCENAQLSSALIQFSPIRSAVDRTPSLPRIRVARLKPLLSVMASPVLRGPQAGWACP